MINRRLLKKLAEQHGTPLFVVDHDQLRRNYAQFKRYLPRVQAYYAVKANSDPAIVKTLYEAGAYVGTGAVITSDVPQDALAIARSRQVVKDGWARDFRAARADAKKK